jgi:DnaJ-class molecular chaperone
MSENYYNILGIPENATKDEIKRAYRTLQMKYHPDKNPNNPEALKTTYKINEAFETLGDEQKRAEYDMSRNNPFSNPFEKMSNHNDIFNMFFGGGNPFANGRPGEFKVFHSGPINMTSFTKPTPIIKTIVISIEQVLSGASIPIEIERWVLEQGNKVFEKETIYIDIPPGIDENEMIILRDKGNVIDENKKGDIKLTISIQNNTLFKRNGLDLILDKHISLKESLCGFKFDIKHLNGKVYTLNNNKGSIIPPEYKKIYTGMGIPRGEHKGNLVIVFHIDFPEKLSDEQIDKLLEIL